MTEEIPKLSTEEIYSVLANRIGKAGEFELLSYEFHLLDKKIGLLCDHIAITAVVNIFANSNQESKTTQTFNFFAKFYPREESQIIFCRETGAFAKEIFMYKLFRKMRSLLDCVPNCYYWKEDHVIVLDNLITEGFKTLNKYQTLDYETVLIVTKSLAKLHASSIIYEEQEAKLLGRAYTIGQDHESDFAETYYHERNETLRLSAASAVKGILSEISYFNFPEKLRSGKNFRKLVVEQVCQKIIDLVKPSVKYRNVVSHGDLWATNFLLKYDADGRPVDCKFVDFQGGRYLPPSHDLMSLLYLTTSRDFRRNHMYRVIGLYYYQLEKILKQSGIDAKGVLSFGQFLESCEEMKPLAIYQSATHFQLVLIDNQRLHELFSDAEFSRYAFEVDRTRLILANIDVNEDYRRRLKESVQDLQDYCETL